MGFWESAEEVIRNMMEDPKERARRRREYLYAEKEKCQKRIDINRMPLRPYAFWTFEAKDSHRQWDARISNAPGRTDPYANISADPFRDLDKPRK